MIVKPTNIYFGWIHKKGEEQTNINHLQNIRFSLMSGTHVTHGYDNALLQL